MAEHVHTPAETGGAHPRGPTAGPVRASATASRLLALQRASGNHAVTRMLAAQRPALVPARVPPGVVQRDLVDFVGTQPDGQTLVKGAGLKKLLRDTENGKLYFRSQRSTETKWILVEVAVGADGKTYEKTTNERTVDVPKKLPRTRQEWQRYAFVSDTAMLYPKQSYPHITFDLKRPAREPGDPVEFETFHYSRSQDDPYRSGYRMDSSSCVCVDPPDKKDKAKECDDEVDKFLAAVGYPMKVTRTKI